MDKVDMENLPIPHTTLSQMVGTWKSAVNDVETAFRMLAGARDTLRDVFGDKNRYRFSIANSNRRLDFDKPDSAILELKKEAWACLVDRLELRRIFSVQRNSELDRQLETGEGLPEITEDQIIGLLDGTLAKAGDYIAEMVTEVFERLRPRGDRYKSNSQFEIGAKVILSWCVEFTYNRTFRVNYHEHKHLTAMENVFHALDGKGSVKGWRGQLIEAIESSLSGHGETEYFKFRCFKNRNLHLEFRRPDLVAKLNQIAGGNRLHSSRPS